MKRSSPLPRSISKAARSGRSWLALWALAFSVHAVQATPLAADAGFAPARPSGSQPLRHAKVAHLGSEQASPEVRHVANWALHSGDHLGLPFAVVDKQESRVFIFDAEGRLRGSTPALVGSARGDHSVPGIGSRPIQSILPEERTTPAGRFAASMGRGPKGEDILWIDYEGALAMHRVVTSVPEERRLQRLASKVALDRRITYGCINLPVKFYENVVVPAFQHKGGIVYILPETGRPQEVFGSYEVAPETAAGVMHTRMQ
ncbi:MAG TPA: L,D-transpeptidase [Ramlibacter sp.]|jgi:hypothetical protein|nr:L,D-transpeptidase [Ramlibacter sp.]